MSQPPSHCVAVIGGAVAGAEVAGTLASRGVEVAVFEQNPRPYGKIEDGLPRWHVALREKEYEAIGENLSKPGVHFVPRTRIGKDVSLRVRNFESSKLKVNDEVGNPIEIAAIVVWRVNDTAQAVLDVENFDDYVHVQSESALRQLATHHPYDSREGGETSLRGSTDLVNTELQHEVADRLKLAGIEVLEARLSHLAYAPEIAGTMLRRQQAEAIISARKRIVEGAVTIVHMALGRLAEQGVVQLDEERKAAMVSNLLVVLCGERGAQPVVNTGTLYNG